MIGIELKLQWSRMIQLLYPRRVLDNECREALYFEHLFHVDLGGSWFPSKIARFSFHFLKQPKKTEEKVPCGPCACMRCCPKKRFHLCFALTIKVTCLLNSGTVIALSSVKATGVRFFRCKTNVIARTIDYRTCSSLWSVSFSLPANLRNLLPSSSSWDIHTMNRRTLFEVLSWQWCTIRTR